MRININMYLDKIKRKATKRFELLHFSEISIYTHTKINSVRFIDFCNS